MATIDVVNLGGEKVGSLELADEVFGAVNEDLLWEAVKHYRAGQRAGTHATKNKKLVSGAGKKLWRAEGYGTRPRGFDPLSSVAAWRHGSRTAAPLLRLLLSRARSCWAHCARRWRRSWPTASWWWWRTSNVEAAKTKDFRKTLDKLNAGKTTLLVSQVHRRDRKEPAPELAQSGRCGVGGGQSGSSLSPAAVRERDLRPSGAGEVAGFAEGDGAQA